MNAERAPAPLDEEPPDATPHHRPRDPLQSGRAEADAAARAGTGGLDAPSPRNEIAPPTRIDVPWSVFAKGIAAFLVMQGLFRFFQQIAAVFVILTLALFLTAALSPLAARLQRWGLGRGLASLIAVGAAILVILALLGLVVPPLVIEVVEFINDLPLHLERLQRFAAANPELFRELEGLAQRLRQDPRAFFTGFLRAGAGAVSLVFSGVLILTLALYFLVDQERIRRALLEHLPRRHRHRVDLTITETACVIRGYFVGQAIVSSIFAVLTFLLLTILGVPYATVLAGLGFILDAIPNIGATLATIVPALVAFASEGIADAVIVIGVVMVYQQIENNFVAPRILGEKLEIPPVLTLVAILVGGAVLGVIGVIIAIPLAGVLPVIDRIWWRRDGAAKGEHRKGPQARG